MKDYKGKRVLVLGLARSGLAAVRLLHTLGAEITVSESKPQSEIKELDELLGLLDRLHDHWEQLKRNEDERGDTVWPKN